MNGEKQKQLLLAAAALLTGALIWFAPADDEVAQPAERKRGEVPAAGAKPASREETAGQSLKTAERVAPENVPDLFASFSWYVPPPPPKPVPPPPPPPPVAPPLPFTFVGQYIDGKTQLLILSRANRVLTVAVGDRIGDTYSVDRYNGSEIEFTYLPLNQKQSLPAVSN